MRWTWTVLVWLLMALRAEAQQKGEINVGIGGDVFESVKARSANATGTTVSSPSIFAGVFVSKKIRLDGEVGALFGEAPGAAEGEGDFSLALALGFRYFHVSRTHFRLNSGLAFETIRGSGGKATADNGSVKSPFELNIVPAEVQWWPMVGGALTLTSFYEVGGLNLGKRGENSYGVKLGMLIRIK